jgi:hypothetical protein
VRPDGLLVGPFPPSFGTFSAASDALIGVSVPLVIFVFVAHYVDVDDDGSVWLWLLKVNYEL